MQTPVTETVSLFAELKRRSSSFVALGSALQLKQDDDEATAAAMVSKGPQPQGAPSVYQGFLSLVVAENQAGYFGVKLNKPGRPKPFEAKVRRAGKRVHLGSFATAEEAAMAIARTPEGHAAARKVAARRACSTPLTSEEARQQARAEGLTLRMNDNHAGYYGVRLNKPGQPKPYQAQVKRGQKQLHLGTFATAEEAALCVARSPEGLVAAKAIAPPPLTREEARQQAQAEGLTLIVARNTAGYRGVTYQNTGHSKPFQAQVQRGGKTVYLGLFATAEEAALCAARSLEGHATAGRAAAALCVARQPVGQPAVEREAAAPLTLTGEDDGAGDDASEEEGEEETVEVLDAVEVLGAWTDDDDDEML